MKTILLILLAVDSYSQSTLRQQSFSPAKTDVSVNSLTIAGSTTQKGTTTILGNTSGFSAGSSVTVNGTILSEAAITPAMRLNVAGSNVAAWTGTSANSIFGTVTNIPLLLYTNDIERGRITAAGELIMASSASFKGPFTISAGSATFADASVFYGDATFWGALGSSGKVIIASAPAAASWDTTIMEITGKGGTTWGLVGQPGSGTGGFSLRGVDGTSAMNVIPDSTLGGRFGFGVAANSTYGILLGQGGYDTRVGGNLSTVGTTNLLGATTISGSSLTVTSTVTVSDLNINNGTMTITAANGRTWKFLSGAPGSANDFFLLDNSAPAFNIASSRFCVGCGATTPQARIEGNSGATTDYGLRATGAVNSNGLSIAAGNTASQNIIMAEKSDGSDVLQITGDGRAQFYGILQTNDVSNLRGAVTISGSSLTVTNGARFATASGDVRIGTTTQGDQSESLSIARVDDGDTVMALMSTSRPGFRLQNSANNKDVWFQFEDPNYGGMRLLDNGANNIIFSVRNNGYGTVGGDWISSGTVVQKGSVNCSTGVLSTSTGALSGCVASDIRLKKNIKLLPYNSMLIDNLRPVSYQWKDKVRGSGGHTGFIAQDVEKVFPSAVVPAGSLKAVDSNALIAVLVKEIQELRKRVNILERRHNK